MTFEVFIEQVTELLKFYLPEEYAGAAITVQEVTKNNDQKLHALCIKRPEDRVVPNIYLEGFYPPVVFINCLPAPAGFPYPAESC